MFAFVIDTEIVPGYRTDRSGIILKLKLLNSETGKSYGKFNNSKIM